MDTTSSKSINWHHEVLPNKTKKALDFLSSQTWLKNSEWYLAGGIALSLQVGNRKSYDLDFFTQNKNFDEKKLLAKFIDNKNWQTEIEEKNTIYGKLFDSKISFIAYPFFVPKQESIFYGVIKVLSPIDIAVMKITAISQRGKKRDFFDLYWCVNNIDSLSNIIKKLPEQYPSVAHDFHHIIKALTYFVDAEEDPEPEIYFETDWQKVKDFFKKEVPIVMKKIMGLK